MYVFHSVLDLFIYQNNIVKIAHKILLLLRQYNFFFVFSMFCSFIYHKNRFVVCCMTASERWRVEKAAWNEKKTQKELWNIHIPKIDIIFYPRWHDGHGQSIAGWNIHWAFVLFPNERGKCWWWWWFFFCVPFRFEWFLFCDEHYYMSIGFHVYIGNAIDSNQKRKKIT